MSEGDVLVLIPARMASSRLPGKALAEVGGRPMIVHMLALAQAAGIGLVAVATDAREIAAVVEAAGGKAVLTRPDHASGSDRIHEAMRLVDPQGRARIILNVQGDMPTLTAAELRAPLDLLADPAVDIGTIATDIRDEAGRVNPHMVKVVGSTVAPGRLRALYFTRATAPWGDGPLYHHFGLYAYRRAALERFVALPPSALERREKLEQLRAIEAGMRIDVALVGAEPLDVNTPEDLARVRDLLRQKA
ncbi:MAG TPA: 3-deoxy-manno-octulosonate cytidylyltransferase [Xanthobacteraceae bacterium]|nr:3-deoxy-manno-octulosonate cytidylyltransferase [Xanthobacteraceae bacterium]